MSSTENFGEYIAFLASFVARWYIFYRSILCSTKLFIERDILCYTNIDTYLIIIHSFTHTHIHTYTHTHTHSHIDTYDSSVTINILPTYSICEYL